MFVNIIWTVANTSASCDANEVCTLQIKVGGKLYEKPGELGETPEELDETPEGLHENFGEPEETSEAESENEAYGKNTQTQLRIEPNMQNAAYRPAAENIQGNTVTMHYCCSISTCTLTQL